MAFFYFMFSGLLGCACAATIGKTSQDLMRREAQVVAPESIILNPHGEMQNSADQQHSPAVFTERGKAQATGNEWDNDFCDDDFILGKIDSSECENSTNHNLISNEGMCEQAAARSNASTVVGSFQISAEWFAIRPKGCFKYPCDESANGVCYYFNSIGEIPQSNITGTPVCQRPKYLFGSLNTNGGCPAGYRVIMSEDECSKAADCLSISEATQFLAHDGDVASYDNYPKGCFVRPAGGALAVDTVFFNAPIDGVTSMPVNPQGKPFCVVSQTLSWGLA